MLAYLELTKPRVTLMVVLTALVSFYLASTSVDFVLLVHTIVGTTLLAAGCAVSNQYLEREVDARMQRTRSRPLPSGRIPPPQALVFGVVLTLGGGLYLAAAANLLTGGLGLVSAALYLFGYTPFKKKSPLCTTIGAFPGATPVLLGWAGARGTLDPEAWILFAVLFLWQYPHFLAIAWVYRDDYRRGGFRMLPQMDPGGKKTARQILVFILLLVPVSLLPTQVGLSSSLYAAGAVILGGVLLWSGLRVSRTRSRSAALHLLKTSVVYLPLLMVLMALDRL